MARSRTSYPGFCWNKRCQAGRPNLISRRVRFTSDGLQVTDKPTAAASIVGIKLIGRNMRAGIASWMGSLEESVSPRGWKFPSREEVSVNILKTRNIVGGPPCRPILRKVRRASRNIESNFSLSVPSIAVLTNVLASSQTISSIGSPLLMDK